MFDIDVDKDDVGGGAGTAVPLPLPLELVNSIREAKFLERSGPRAILDLVIAAMFCGGDAAGIGIDTGVGIGIEIGMGRVLAAGGPKPGGGDGGPWDTGGTDDSVTGVSSMPPSREPVRSPCNG